MAHKHSVYDNDKHFSIDPVTREITNESGKFVLIQHDHNSERFTFEIPKEVDGHDMSQCNVVQIHYLNVELEKADLDMLEADGINVETVVLDNIVYVPTGTVYSGIYESDDVQISPASEEVVICSWLISRNATQYLGVLNFIVRFTCVADDGTVEYAWSTSPCKGVVISDSIFNSDIVIAEYPDLLEKWRNDVYAKVQKQIDAAVEGASVFNFEATIPADGWVIDDDGAHQQIAIEGLLADDNPIPGINMAAIGTNELRKLTKEEAGKIYRMTARAGIFQVYAEDAATVDIPIILQVVR